MMTDQQVIDAASDVQVLALTMIGEAVGDSRDGSSVEERIAVGCVMRNRLRAPGRFGDNYRHVCLARRQFSCWNNGDPNQPRLLRIAYLLVTHQPTLDPLVEETLFVADGISRGVVLDRVKGATHYLTTVLLKTGTVAWAKGLTPVATCGAHSFFAGVA